MGTKTVDVQALENATAACDGVVGEVLADDFNIADPAGYAEAISTLHVLRSHVDVFNKIHEPVISEVAGELRVAEDIFQAAVDKAKDDYNAAIAEARKDCQATADIARSIKQTVVDEHETAIADQKASMARLCGAWKKIADRMALYPQEVREGLKEALPE